VPAHGSGSTAATPSAARFGLALTTCEITTCEITTCEIDFVDLAGTPFVDPAGTRRRFRRDPGAPARPPHAASCMSAAPAPGGAPKLGSNAGALESGLAWRPAGGRRGGPRSAPAPPRPAQWDRRGITAWL